MTSRERVIKTLQHEEPDRVPMDLGGSLTNAGIAKKAHQKLKEHLGFIDNGKEEMVSVIGQLVRPDQRILDRFEADIYGISAKPPKSWIPAIKEDESNYYCTDEWGIKYRMPKAHGYFFDMVEHPLADIKSIEELKDYRWPDPHDPGRVEKLEEEVKNLYETTEYALFLNAPGAGIFEKALFLRGFENFCIDLVRNPELAKAVLDLLVEFYVACWSEVLSRVGKYVQVIKMGDDLAGQNGPLINPETYRKIIKPREKEVASFIKKRTKAKLYMHSCGAMYDFIPDLIEIGVEVLNPVQVSAKGMDTKRLKKEFGKRLSFWGAVDTQKVLAFGTTRDVEMEVKRRIGDLGPGGGYILSSVHNIQANVAPENIAAMFKAAKKHGSYPVKL